MWILSYYHIKQFTDTIFRRGDKDENIIFKKRGVGMFVSDGAVQKLRQKRQDQFYTNYISSLIEEAKRLGITSDDIIAMIERGFSQ